MAKECAQLLTDFFASKRTGRICPKNKETMYPEEIKILMRADLIDAGYEEMRTAEEVDAVLGKAEGTVLVMINSVCGCAAGNVRPAAKEQQHTTA